MGSRLVRPVVAATVAVMSLATGCGGGDDGDGLSSSAEDRRRMPSCGAYQVPEGPLADEDRAVRDCFLAAFGAGRQMEVSITALSVEGDPIVTLYRVLGANDVELFVDASADTFSATPTYHQRCTSVVEDGGGLAAGGCTVLP